MNKLFSSFLILTVFFTLLSLTARAQSIQAIGCDSVGVKTISFPQNAIFSASVVSELSRCEKIISEYVVWGYAKIWLQKQNPDGTWSDVNTNPVLSRILTSSSFDAYGDALFTGLAPGIYRGKYTIPEPYRVDCGNIVYHTLIFLNYGFQAVSSSFIYTPAIAVGAISDDDVDYSFVDENTNNNPVAYDFADVVKINTTGTSSNHTDWWLAIFELGGQQRYYSIGWNSGLIPSEIDVTNIWVGQAGYTFESLNSYKLQVAVSNPCNEAWAVKEETFFICPFGSGCKVVSELPEITVGPNPVKDVLYIQGLGSLGKNTSYDFFMYDFAGRQVRSLVDVPLAEVEVSDLTKGVYAIQIWSGGKQLFVGKIVKD